MPEITRVFHAGAVGASISMQNRPAPGYFRGAAIVASEDSLAASNMVPLRAKTSRVATVTKAIAEAPGTDDVSLARGARPNEIDIIPSKIDDIAREGIRLGSLMHDMSRMRRSAYDAYMQPLGVTRAQWWVLAHLSRHDGMMQTFLADVLEVGKASVGNVIERFETAG